ncbi:MAG: DUF47 family protein [Tissierellia bacterium]|nr:DUF47 family protein [Tissierellia bacterium]
MLRKNFDYFNFFIKLVKYSNQAAQVLNESLKNFKVHRLDEKRKILESIKYKACGEEVARKLAKEFITPIDREDIVILIQELNNIIAYIEDVLSYIYMHNVKVIREDAVKFSELLLKNTNELYELFIEFKNFRKSKELYSKIYRLKKTEEEDKLYAEIVRNLHMTTYNAVDIMVWVIIYDGLKKSSFKCKEIVNIIERIIQKSS